MHPPRGSGIHDAQMRIAEFLSQSAVIPELASKTKADALRELATRLARENPAITYEQFLAVLEEREKVGSTGMEKGVAIPHGRLAELSNLVAVFGVSRPGIDFEARDGRTSQFFFALVAPENSAGLHLKALSKLSRLFRSDALKDALLAASTAEQIYALIMQEDARP